MAFDHLCFGVKRRYFRTKHKAWLSPFLRRAKHPQPNEPTKKHKRYESLPIASHPLAKENRKRPVSPSRSPKKPVQMQLSVEDEVPQVDHASNTAPHPTREVFFLRIGDAFFSSRLEFYNSAICGGQVRRSGCIGRRLWATFWLDINGEALSGFLLIIPAL